MSAHTFLERISAMALPIIKLTPPIITPDHIDQKMICIRAHRERIFDLSVQRINGKLICNNFGQGGAGWTFLFGCVAQSIANFESALQNSPSLKRKPIAVIGAGCYGLLTAIELVHKGYTVQIYAKELQDIPSHKAAGFFFPGAHKRATKQEHAIYDQIGMASYRAYLSILNGTHPFLTHGPMLLPAYYDKDIDPGFVPYIQADLIKPARTVSLSFGSDQLHPAIEYQQIYINPIEIMPQLEALIAKLGIPISITELHDFNELNEEIIFNCSGLGAKTLIDDSRIIPVQGHLITLKNQPPIEQLRYLINYRVSSEDENGKKRNDFIYYAPRHEGILGITFLRGRHCLQDNEHEFDRIIERSMKFFR